MKVGRKRITVKVMKLGPVGRKNSVFAIFGCYPNGTKWRIPGTDTKIRVEAIKRAKQIRAKVKEYL